MFSSIISAIWTIVLKVFGLYTPPQAVYAVIEVREISDLSGKHQTKNTNNIMLILTDEQKATLAVAFKTAAGNAANVDGKPTWSSSNPSVAEVRASEDGLSAVVLSRSLGEAQISVVADAALSEDVRELIGLLDVKVIAAEAVTVAISTGAPELKDAEPAPAPTPVEDPAPAVPEVPAEVPAEDPAPANDPVAVAEPAPGDEATEKAPE